MKSFVFSMVLYLLFAANSYVIAEEDVDYKIEESNYTSSLVCGKCHEAIYSKWKNSMHAQSISDPIFNLAYMQAVQESGEKAKKLCLSCHAPAVRANNDYELNKAITNEGIMCDFCHTVKGVDLNNQDNPYIIDVGEVKRSTIRGAESPVHKVEHSELHAKSEFCAGCHEFNKDKVTIIGTYSEWKEGPYSKEGVQCQDCHMPLIKGLIVRQDIKEVKGEINLHDLQGGHSVEQLRKAMRVRIVDTARSGDGVTVKVEITNIGSGHTVPTGLPSRELVLQMIVKDSKGRIISRDEKIYKKVLADENGNEIKKDHEFFLKGKTILSDNRIKPRETKETVFYFSYPKREELSVETKLFYRYKPEVISTQEMFIEMGGDSRVIR